MHRTRQPRLAASGSVSVDRAAHPRRLAASGSVSVVGIPRHVVVIDNYDSFTYNLVHLLEALGARCSVVLNDGDDARAVLAQAPAGVVISPGPGRPERAGITPQAISVLLGKVPLLGVCLGHQALAQHCGAEIVPAPRLMHGKTSPIDHDGRGIFRGLPSPFVATRYHSLIVAGRSFPQELEVSARSDAHEVMALRHRRHHAEGVQFHPESVMSEWGRQLLDNWLNMLGNAAENQTDQLAREGTP